uniref:Uncharacterized protein n=1 Tax=Globisporangium ultimum (strain ATCC 200006 / CBS 805.95 / DAOM BR144) TaxID=431595 RepID=K3WEN7_GLOUD
MANFGRMPVVRASFLLLLLVLLGTLSAGAHAASNDTGCATCRDTDNCETAVNGKPGKFCNTYNKMDYDSANRFVNESLPCCCGVEEKCLSDLLACSCQAAVLTPQTSQPTKINTKSSGFWTTARIGLFVGCALFAVAAGVGYYFWMKASAKKVFGPTGMPQVYVAQSVHAHHGHPHSGAPQQMQQAYGGNGYNGGGGNDHHRGAGTVAATRYGGVGEL